MAMTLVEKQIDYDKRSSVFVNVGEGYGSGKPQPIGSKQVKKDFDPTKGLNLKPNDEAKR